MKRLFSDPCSISSLPKQSSFFASAFFHHALVFDVSKNQPFL
jgi:hypothetical protein